MLVAIIVGSMVSMQEQVDFTRPFYSTTGQAVRTNTVIVIVIVKEMEEVEVVVIHSGRIKNSNYLRPPRLQRSVATRKRNVRKVRKVKRTSLGPTLSLN